MVELLIALALPFKATLHAPTHTPRANTPWPISIRATDLHARQSLGRALKALR